ncbi:syntaxin-43-like isoform X3 [Durio zibethinus]|nr:syntaxin-43-like isoform X3 [Durio zibethinus]
MAVLAKAHAKALMPSFGDGKEDQRNIEALTHEITNLLKKSEKRLQKLSAAGPSEDSNVRKNVQRSLATDLQNLSMELRKKQSTYLKRLRQQKEGQDGVDLEMNLNGNRSKAEEDDLDYMVFNEHQMAKLKQSEAFTIEREREIQQVVESVNELAQIMKDLSVLVIDQGTIVDRIDYNIQNVATTVEEGLKQLQKVFGLCPLLIYNYMFSGTLSPSLSLILVWIGLAGGENTETRRDGDVCFSACYYVLCHAGPPNPQGDTLLICKHGFPFLVLLSFLEKKRREGKAVV